jgi:hypothetical protein
MLNMQNIADLVGVGYQSIRVYRGRAIFNERNGNVRPGDLPPADSYTGQTPLWKPETIEAWAKARPRAGRIND